MNDFHQQVRGKIQWVIGSVRGFCRNFQRMLWEQFNKNIYTRILFTNVATFAIGLIMLILFSSFIVKQLTYDQVEQDLFRKAKRVNYALLEQTNTVWGKPPAAETADQAKRKQDYLIYLSDLFDAKITIFDRAGTIWDTSAEQEVLPGSKVEANHVARFTNGETAVTRTMDRETGRLAFRVVVPMGNNKNTIEYGILLETQPSNQDLAINKMQFFLVIGGMGILFFIIIVSVYLAMFISRPISRLATHVAEISRGSYVLNTDDQPLDEINALAGQLNKLTERLQKVQTESVKMDEDRARLFAEISHEIRTPLTAVQGFVEAIRDGMVQDEALRLRYMDTIYTQTIHITRLVDDILVLSRLESGNITVEKLPVDLVALAQGVVISMEAMAASRNTMIRVEKKTEKAIVIGDVDRLEQIIRNLLKNAVVATENGLIRVSVAVSEGEVVLTIEDNGIGIAPEDLPHIWDRFYRVKNQHGQDRQEKGSGLGLVIVKKLVQLQGGKIDVTSQLGKGTAFSMTFPLFNPK
ncbi:HAMP domain-containing histidine kinase [Dehalobacter sp. DCM]|uniref:sensor histidine kinase n=1 Tax=Dehalobacter sp. DCM TaxID=2907827 RepID=UPI0030820C48|nr:HAMP domain-containing histidine kinase [Dehalobacter sp. DCM]